MAVQPDLNWRPTLKRRLTVAASLFALWAVGIEVRLVILQVKDHDDLVARADRQQMRTVTAPAKRGEIYDRRGRLLAYSVDADTIYAVPTEIADPAQAAAAIVRRPGRVHEEGSRTAPRSPRPPARLRLRAPARHAARGQARRRARHRRASVS